MSNAALVAQAIKVEKRYHDANQELRVLRGIDMEVRAGEALAIIGASGAGKSTLLHLLGGLDHPTSGSILINGKPHTDLTEREVARRRAAEIGIIYQFHHLLPEFSALENVMMPAMINGLPIAKARELATERLAEVGLSERLSHRPAKLSGGEQQRVALARALVNKPSLILADEPTGNLDADTAREAVDLLWNNTLAKGRALVIVTHEPNIARKADRILRLNKGLLEECTADYKAER